MILRSVGVKTISDVICIVDSINLSISRRAAVVRMCYEQAFDPTKAGRCNHVLQPHGGWGHSGYPESTWELSNHQRGEMVSFSLREEMALSA